MGCKLQVTARPWHGISCAYCPRRNYLTRCPGLAPLSGLSR